MQIYPVDLEVRSVSVASKAAKVGFSFLLIPLACRASCPGTTCFPKITPPRTRNIFSHFDKNKQNFRS